MRNQTERIVELEPKGPDCKGNFDKEERGDPGRNQGEHLEPGRVAFGPARLALGVQEGISEIHQDAYGIDDDLQKKSVGWVSSVMIRHVMHGGKTDEGDNELVNGGGFQGFANAGAPGGD